jgi:cell division protein FtsQ
VKEASVSRIWPNRILVRITERKPVAFVNLPLAENARAARLSLIDAEGEFLEPPAAGNFNFPVLRGIHEQQTKDARRLRVQAMQQLVEELGPLAANVSEIDAANLEDMRMVAQVTGRAFELEMGDSGFKKRLQHFMSHYPEIQRKAPEATSFDLRLDDQIIRKE